VTLYVLGVAKTRHIHLVNTELVDNIFRCTVIQHNDLISSRPAYKLCNCAIVQLCNCAVVQHSVGV
jgi:hypothetical protein